MTMLARQTMSVEEYLEFEKTSEIRHEFVDGQIYAMAGEKKQHNRIAFRIAKLLDDAAQQKGCQVYLENIKVRTRGTKYRYPDIVVTCEQNDDEYTVFDPCALFEVLSSSTEEIDGLDKVEEYLKLSGLQRYVMLRQDRAAATVYSRDPSGWHVEIIEDSGEFDVPCLNTKLTLEQIYAGLLETEPS
jgi:Uma2 family endonuclease